MEEIYLTDEQIDILCEMSEIHFQCFEKYYKEYNISYESVLELNHKKMIEILEFCYDERSSRIIFNGMLKEYNDMLNRNKIN
jgi:hypothetical protein